MEPVEGQMIDSNNYWKGEDDVEWVYVKFGCMPVTSY